MLKVVAPRLREVLTTVISQAKFGIWISGRTGRLNSTDFPSCLTEIQQNLLIGHVGFVVRRVWEGA